MKHWADLKNIDISLYAWKVTLCAHNVARRECPEPECVVADVMEEPRPLMFQQHYKKGLGFVKCPKEAPK